MSLFERSIVPHAGSRARGFIATCGHCGVVGTVPVNTFKGCNDTQEEKFVAKRLEGNGWKIGGRTSQHRCPGCFSAIKIAAVKKSKDNKMALGDDPRVSAVLATFPKKADDPREPCRDDRRIIFEKLQEVYINEKDGYSPGWTDAKVASDLGIPRAWVAKVRDENFGPEGSNEDIRKAVEEARAVLSECRKAADTFKIILNKADKIEKTLVEIQRALN